MNLNDLKERINKLKDAAANGNVDLRDKLSEEGIKALVIVPIIQEHLGFTDIDDYKFEDPQGSHQTFLDIVLQEKFLFELKKFNLLSDLKEEENARKQITKYISYDKDNIHFGILTDGFIWQFFMDKRFIEKYGNEGGNQVEEIEKDVPLCLSFNIQDENFWNLLMMFHKDVYEKNVKNILAKGIVNKVTNKGGRIGWYNLFAKLENTGLQETCGNYVSNEIDKYFKKELGEFYEDIKSKKIQVDSRLKYEDDYLYLEAIITKTGHLKVDPKKCRLKLEKQLEAVQKYPSIMQFLFTVWPNSEADCTYQGEIDLYKAVYNKSRLSPADKADIEKRWTNL